MQDTISQAAPRNSLVIESNVADALEAILVDPPVLQPTLPATALATDFGGGVVVGALVDFNDRGEPVVTWRDRTSERLCAARSMAPFDASRIGAEVALAFERGDATRPIILGFLTGAVVPAATSPLPLQATVDGDRLELTASREIILRCGDASITLTRAGKVIIRGAYLLSRSTGVNSIKGGSVQIN